MNEQLQKAILDLINGAKHFTIDQAPDVIQQYLMAESIDAQVGIWFSGVIIFIGLLMIVYSCLEDFRELCFGFGLSILVAALFFLGCNISNLQKIKYAPKGYLLEKVVGQ